MPDSTTTTYRSGRFYDEAGEFLDILMAGYWDALGPAVAAQLSDAGLAAGPVVDIGAGSGRSTVVAARAVPTREVIAVEPHPVLRAVLLSTVAAAADLRDRVTVLDGEATTVPLPGQVGALLLLNMLGHLDPSQRALMWRRAAAQLPPGGRLIANVQPPERPQSIPATPTADVGVGRRRYRCIAAAEPAGVDSIEWEMTYQVLEGDLVVQERTARDLWWVLDSDRAAAEAAEAGLDLRLVDPASGLMVATA